MYILFCLLEFNLFLTSLFLPEACLTEIWHMEHMLLQFWIVKFSYVTVRGLPDNSYWRNIIISVYGALCDLSWVLCAGICSNLFTRLFNPSMKWKMKDLKTEPIAEGAVDGGGVWIRGSREVRLAVWACWSVWSDWGFGDFRIPVLTWRTTDDLWSLF